MAITPQTYMSRADLTYYNKTVNDRLRWRLKYKGEYAILEDQTNWNDFAPSEPGHLWKLTDTNVKKIEIDDVSYRAGEWVMVMNKTIKNDDGTIVDEDGNPADVQVIKLGGAGLEDGEDNGDGLAFVDGEWTIQKKYGYYVKGPNEKENDTQVTISGSAYLDIPGFIAGKEYTITMTNEDGVGDYTETFTVSDPNLIELHDEPGGWEKIIRDHGAYHLIAGGNLYARQYHVVVEGELLGTFEEFDRRYIPAAARGYEEFKDIPDDDTNRDGDVFVVRHDTRNMNVGLHGLTADAIAAGWTVEWDGLHGPDDIFYTFEQIAANASDLHDDGILEEKNDEGELCSVELTNGIVIYDRYTAGDDFEDIKHYYADQKVYINDEELGYLQAYSRDDMRNTFTPIHATIIKNLPDNMYDE